MITLCMHGFNMHFVIDDHNLMFPNVATPCVCGSWLGDDTVKAWYVDRYDHIIMFEVYEHRRYTIEARTILKRSVRASTPSVYFYSAYKIWSKSILIKFDHFYRKMYSIIIIFKWFHFN